MAEQLHTEHKSGAHSARRFMALFASIFVGLASGTPYLYGIYSPQLVQRVGLTTSDSATISLALNFGSGIGGLVGGVMIDHKGPRFLIFLGSVMIFLGYAGLYQIYFHAYKNLIVLCGCAVIVGLGSITAYFASLKASQANFPHHRGTAGVFPVSSYGLAASLFSVITAHFFEDDTAGLLRFLSLCCGATACVGSYFVGIFVEEPEDDEEEVLAQEGSSGESQPLLRLESFDSQVSQVSQAYDSADEQSLAGSFSFWGLGTRTPRTSFSSLSEVVPAKETNKQSTTPMRPDFLSRNNSFSNPKNSPVVSKANSIENLQNAKVRKHKRKKTPLEIIGDLLSNKIFLVHYLLVALIAGVGQNYIYSVGFIVTAQVKYNHDYPLTTAQVQAIQVAILSIGSFSGRFASGIVSDFIHKKWHIQRLWIITLNITFMVVGEAVTISNVSNVHLISLASACIGGSFGLTFGVYPAIIADFFGTKTFSTTWGLICTGPLFLLYVLNKYFGAIYDSNTDVESGICFKGNGCYKAALQPCFYLCFLMYVITFLLIYIHRKR